MKLSELLDEARDRALEQLKKRSDDKEEGQTMVAEEKFLDTAERLGMAAIKYYDLK